MDYLIHHLHISKYSSDNMRNPFRKIQNDFSSQWMDERRILSEYKSAFNMSHRELKKGLRRIRREHDTNEGNEKKNRINLEKIEREVAQLKIKQGNLQKEPGAKESLKLRAVNLDISTRFAESETLQKAVTDSTMKNVDLRSTKSLLEKILNGTYKTTEDATKEFIQFRPTVVTPGGGRLPSEDIVNNEIPISPTGAEDENVVRDPVSDYDEGM